jgi:hypothetical protein
MSDIIRYSTNSSFFSGVSATESLKETRLQAFTVYLCLCVTDREPLNEFIRNLTLTNSTQICRRIPILQKYYTNNENFYKNDIFEANTEMTVKTVVL